MIALWIGLGFIAGVAASFGAAYIYALMDDK